MLGRNVLAVVPLPYSDSSREQPGECHLHVNAACTPGGQGCSSWELSAVLSSHPVLLEGDERVHSLGCYILYSLCPSPWRLPGSGGSTST